MKSKKAWSTKPEEIHERAYNNRNAAYLKTGNVPEYVAATDKADKAYNRNIKRIAVR